MIDNIIKNPDKLPDIYDDSTITSTNFSRNMLQMKEHKLLEKNIKREIYHIKEYFNKGYTIEEDKISKMNEENPQNYREHKFKYYIHHIVLTSKLDKTKNLFFDFVDENNNNNWRLESLRIIEAPR